MIIHNKINKTVSGPVILVGLTSLILGLKFVFTQQWIAGPCFLIVAFFLLFTYSGVEVDTERHKIKKFNKIFGIIKTGRWETVEKYKGVTLVNMKQVQAIFSLSNRKTETTGKFFQVYLINQNRKPELAIKKCKTLESGQDSLDEFSLWLKLPVFTLKK